MLDGMQHRARAGPVLQKPVCSLKEKISPNKFTAEPQPTPAVYHMFEGKLFSSTIIFANALKSETSTQRLCVAKAFLFEHRKRNRWKAYKGVLPKTRVLVHARSLMRVDVVYLVFGGIWLKSIRESAHKWYNATLCSRINCLVGWLSSCSVGNAASYDEFMRNVARYKVGRSTSVHQCSPRLRYGMNAIFLQTTSQAIGHLVFRRGFIKSQCWLPSQS